MKLKCKKYVKEMVMVLCYVVIPVLVFFGLKAINEITFVQENFKIILAISMCVFLICYIIISMATGKVVINKKESELEESKEHKEDDSLNFAKWYMIWLAALIISIFLGIMGSLLFTSINATKPNNQSVSMLDIEN